MLIIRRYKKNRSGKSMWEYKITFRDKFTGKIKTRRRKGFQTKAEAETAAHEALDYLHLPLSKLR